MGFVGATIMLLFPDVAPGEVTWDRVLPSIPDP